MVLYMAVTLKITHWFPIVTFCPVNGLPDFVYVTVSFNEFQELYEVRRKIKSAIQFKKVFMEDAALFMKTLFPKSTSVEVRLMFSKHIVTVEE
jgi:hypothetical protein